jgi:uncharacterized protein (DUF2249 family)
LNAVIAVAMTLSTPISTIDVRSLAPRERHATILGAFKALRLDEALEVVSDHDPRPLYRQFQTDLPGSFAWLYAQNGPDVWRVSIRKLARAHGAGECCGVCGSGS